ncbi:FecR family protein [Flavobacterium flavipallidum]|uniref:FecR domain-containing protein n=1 Tax=Flavobacterium flavipallidum TaxID=3139140 RepID=A0ABU9HM38_9FLAO
MEFKLIVKKINNTLTQEEEVVFSQWYHQSDDNKVYFEKVKNNYYANLNPDNIDLDTAWYAIKSNIKPQRRIKYYYAVAASVVILFGLGYFFSTNDSLNQNVNQNTIVESTSKSNEVILTLADGSKVVLNNQNNGVVANQENVTITKDKDGQIIYNDSKQVHNGKPSFNTLNIPNGQTFQVTLPDGTNVWLNAGSSLKYPTYFEGNNRTVVLTGEAYFEVAHNLKMPFKVFSNGQEVEVLGTHFNIRAYANEPFLKTTLLEGRIKISEGNNKAIVKPGEQIVVSLGKHHMYSKQVNVESAIAWKNRLFYFENARYDEIMREIERWYDVEVIYKNKMSNERFEGAIQKDLPLNQVLKMLESEDVHFKIQGKEVIVTQ